jgi:hypothetical protein
MFPAQPEQDMDDIKLPPHVLEHLDNSQLSSGSDVYYDTTIPSVPPAWYWTDGRTLSQLEVGVWTDGRTLAQREVGEGKEAEWSGTAYWKTAEDSEDALK